MIVTLWKVIYNSLEITKTSDIQIDWLSEDLLQIDYGNYLIDVWYYQDCFIVLCIKKFDRINPILRITFNKNSINEINNAIKECESVIMLISNNQDTK